MAHHRFTADKCDLKRFVPVHQVEHATNQVVAALIGQVAELYVAAEVI
jgi:hypothetical protein